MDEHVHANFSIRFEVRAKEIKPLARWIGRPYHVETSTIG
jgi:hypothetical protein